MKNWKTTISALVAAVAGFVAMHPMYTAHYPIINDIAGYIMVGGLAGIGFAAKDSTTHSTIEQIQGSSIAGGSSVQSMKLTEVTEVAAKKADSKGDNT